jgi:hypothetical protein
MLAILRQCPNSPIMVSPQSNTCVDTLENALRMYYRYATYIVHCIVGSAPLQSEKYSVNNQIAWNGTPPYTPPWDKQSSFWVYGV